MAAILIDIKPGDEVIMPSYTFVSTANAFVLRGARIVFVDIRPDTMNIDEKLIESAITDKTRAIVVVHYAGVACEMDAIMKIGNKYSLYVIEDAAQGMMSKYKSKPLGTIGHLGTYSFHETKNYTSGGEGGLLIINERTFAERAEIIREKGTDRCKFFRGQVNKYSWVDVGSSYLLSDIQAAYLYAQLELAQEINASRLDLWKRYYEGLRHLSREGKLIIPKIPQDCIHNGHMFYIKLKDIDQRNSFIDYMKENNIMCVFHYVPLHSSPFGKKISRFHGSDVFTTKESNRLLRLPMFYGMSQDDSNRILRKIAEYDF